jgi:hypothetical protein
MISPNLSTAVRFDADMGIVRGEHVGSRGKTNVMITRRKLMDLAMLEICDGLNISSGRVGLAELL